MKRTFSVMSVLVVVMLFSQFGHAKSIPLVQTNFYLFYDRNPCSGGYYWYLPLFNVFTFKKGTVHISSGNLSDKSRCYSATMKLANRGDRFKLASNFKVELSFKNFRVSGSRYGSTSISIQSHNRNVHIGISSWDKQNRYWTHLGPDDPRSLDLPARSNSGTFVIEKKGTNITLSVKGVPKAKITYNGLDFVETGVRIGIWSEFGSKTEVDITGLNVTGLVPRPPGPPAPRPPPPPPPPQPHGFGTY